MVVPNFASGPYTTELEAVGIKEKAISKTCYVQRLVWELYLCCHMESHQTDWEDCALRLREKWIWGLAAPPLTTWH